MSFAFVKQSGYLQFGVRSYWAEMDAFQISLWHLRVLDCSEYEWRWKSFGLALNQMRQNVTVRTQRGDIASVIPVPKSFLQFWQKVYLLLPTQMTNHGHSMPSSVFGYVAQSENHSLFSGLPALSVKHGSNSSLDKQHLNNGHDPSPYSRRSFRCWASNLAVDVRISRQEILTDE